MGLPQFHPSAIVAMAVTLLTALGLIAAPELPSAHERDSFVRMTRGGIQRLGMGDTTAHDSEPGESIIAPDRPIAADRLSVHAPPGPPGALPVHAAPAVDFVLLINAAIRPVVLLRPDRPSLGRAPPSA